MEEGNGIYHKCGLGEGQGDEERQFGGEKYSTRFFFSAPRCTLTEKSWETVHLSDLENQLWEWWSNAPEGILCGLASSTSQEGSSRVGKSQNFLS